MLTTDKQLREILRDAEGRGWQFSNGKRHIKARHPSGQTATIARTPSDVRAYQNIMNNLKLRPR